MTEIAIRDNTGGMALSEKIEYAKALAVASMLPKQYQQNPGNLLFAIEYADALDIKPIHAITGIHVIEGKPSASADLIAALVRRAGHRLRVTGDDQKCVAQIIRSDDPDFTYEAVWTMEKARNAGIASKSVWKNYPKAMLRSRAITEVARDGASEALYGVIYTPEELGADVDAQGTPIITTVSEPTTPRSSVSRLRSAVTAAPEEVNEPTPAAEPATEPEITAAQLKKLHTMFSKVGYTDREHGLAYIARAIGREVESSKDLTKAEAVRIIDSLENHEGADVKTGEVVEAEVVEPDESFFAELEAEASR